MDWLSELEKQQSQREKADKDCVQTLGKLVKERGLQLVLAVEYIDGSAIPKWDDRPYIYRDERAQ